MSEISSLSRDSGDADAKAGERMKTSPKKNSLARFMFRSGPVAQNLDRPLDLADLMTDNLDLLTQKHEEEHIRVRDARAIPRRAVSFVPKVSQEMDSSEDIALEGSSSLNGEGASVVATAAPVKPEQRNQQNEETVKEVAAQPKKRDFKPDDIVPESESVSEAVAVPVSGKQTMKSDELGENAARGAMKASENERDQASFQEVTIEPPRRVVAKAETKEQQFADLEDLLKVSLLETRVDPRPAQSQPQDSFTLQFLDQPDEVPVLPVESQTVPRRGSVTQEVVEQNPRKEEIPQPNQRDLKLQSFQVQELARPAEPDTHSTLVTQQIPKQAVVQTEPQVVQQQVARSRSTHIQTRPQEDNFFVTTATAVQTTQAYQQPVQAVPPTFYYPPPPQIVYLPVAQQDAQVEQSFEEYDEESGSPQMQQNYVPPAAQPRKNLNELYCCAWEVPADDIKGPRPKKQEQESPTAIRNKASQLSKPWKTGSVANLESKVQESLAPPANAPQAVAFDVDTEVPQQVERSPRPVYFPRTQRELLAEAKRSPMTFNEKKTALPDEVRAVPPTEPNKGWQECLRVLQICVKLFEKSLEEAEQNYFLSRYQNEPSTAQVKQQEFLRELGSFYKLLLAKNYLRIRKLPFYQQAVLLAIWKECTEETKATQIIDMLRKFDFNKQQRTLAVKCFGYISHQSRYRGVQELLEYLLDNLDKIDQTYQRNSEQQASAQIETFNTAELNKNEDVILKSPVGKKRRFRGLKRQQDLTAQFYPMVVVTPQPVQQPPQMQESPQQAQQAPGQQAAQSNAEPVQKCTGETQTIMVISEAQTDLMLTSPKIEAASQAECAVEQNQQMCQTETIDLSAAPLELPPELYPPTENDVGQAMQTQATITQQPIPTQPVVQDQIDLDAVVSVPHSVRWEPSKSAYTDLREPDVKSPLMPRQKQEAPQVVPQLTIKPAVQPAVKPKALELQTVRVSKGPEPQDDTKQIMPAVRQSQSQQNPEPIETQVRKQPLQKVSNQSGEDFFQNKPSMARRIRQQSSATNVLKPQESVARAGRRPGSIPAGNQRAERKPIEQPPLEQQDEESSFASVQELTAQQKPQQSGVVPVPAPVQSKDTQMGKPEEASPSASAKSLPDPLYNVFDYTAHRPEKQQLQTLKQHQELNSLLSELLGGEEEEREDVQKQILQSLTKPVEASPKKQNAARPASQPAPGRAETARRLEAKDVLQKVLLKDCPETKKQIAPDSLYFGPEDAGRRVRFGEEVHTVVYFQEPEERRYYMDEDPGWPGEDME